MNEINLFPSYREFLFEENNGTTAKKILDIFKKNVDFKNAEGWFKNLIDAVKTENPQTKYNGLLDFGHRKYPAKYYEAKIDYSREKNVVTYLDEDGFEFKYELTSDLKCYANDTTHEAVLQFKGYFLIIPTSFNHVESIVNYVLETEDLHDSGYDLGDEVGNVDRDDEIAIFIKDKWVPFICDDAPSGSYLFKPLSKTKGYVMPSKEFDDLKKKGFICKLKEI